MQIADIRYTSKDAFAGSALHILHRGSNYVVYIATAQETGLKLLLKAYDLGQAICKMHASLRRPPCKLVVGLPEAICQTATTASSTFSLCVAQC